MTNSGVTKNFTQVVEILYMTLKFSEWAQNHGVRVLSETVNNFRIATS
jgi:hypothetical protein